MARLSQRSWNNVIIFAMLIMIFVLNFSSVFKGSPDEIQDLFAEGEIVLALQLDQNLIERVGQTWRLSASSPANQSSVDASQLADLVAAWKSVRLKSQTEIASTSLPAPEHIVVMWLAGEREGRVFALQQIDGRAYLSDNNVTLRLVSPAYQQLITW